MRTPTTKLGIARLIALILVGAVPATYLCYFSAAFALRGFGLFLTEREYVNLLFSLWGVMGVIGTVSLWRICFGYLSSAAYIGLIFGIVAAIAVPVVFGWNQDDLASNFVSGLTMPPVLVALYLLGELVYRVRRFAVLKEAEPGA